METEYLKSLFLIFALSAVSVFVLHRLRIPAMVGFIVSGILLGPKGLGVIQDTNVIKILSEIGIILLLFTIGVEFSLRNLLKTKRAVLIGGGQVILTALLVFVPAYMLGLEAGKALFYGFIAAMSSTAVVLKTFMERGEVDSPHGRAAIGILIFQDLAVVPIMLFLPMMSGSGFNAPSALLTILKASLIIFLVLTSAKWIVPFIFRKIVQTRNREMFTVGVLLACVGTAVMTSELGLSLALGAFMAGLVVSESEFAYAAMAETLPFKESFMGLFFVSIGMMVDPVFVLQNLPKIALAIAAISVIKLAAGSLPLFVSGYAARVSIHAGIATSQIGEFSFMLAATGLGLGLIDEGAYQTFLSAAIITMAMTPIILSFAPRIMDSLGGRLKLSRVDSEDIKDFKIKDHVIIIGFGLNGKNLARTLRESGIEYVVAELNSETVATEKAKGEPIYFCDATSPEILHKLKINSARSLVVAISDPAASRKIVSIARGLNRSLYIIVRTRFLAEVDDLKTLGADEVIPEEFETSVEIFSRVLTHYNVPRNIINDNVDKIRRDNYLVLRSPSHAARPLYSLIGDMDTEKYLVRQGSAIKGSSLKEHQIRTKTGATVIALERDGILIQNPSPDTVIIDGDVLFLIGAPKDISNAIEYLDGQSG